MQAEIKGTTMPVLEVTLQRGEQVVSTHGELSWMTCLASRTWPSAATACTWSR
jgi:uncharacterized protein (AIM24 family)